MQYIQLNPESRLPDISSLKPFRCVVIIEEAVTPEWQMQVSDWLIKSGCLYMMAWGKTCATWEDSITEAMTKANTPADESLIITSHPHNSLMEVFWSAKHSAFHPKTEIRNTLLLHISNTNKLQQFLREYAAV